MQLSGDHQLVIPEDVSVFHVAVPGEQGANVYWRIQEMIDVSLVQPVRSTLYCYDI